MNKDKMQKVLGAALVIGMFGFGIAAVAVQEDTVILLEQSLKASKETYVMAKEACNKAEIALAQAKLETKGAASLPIEEIAKLQKKVKGEGLQMCAF
jgi:hypothetical protein